MNSDDQKDSKSPYSIKTGPSMDRSGVRHTLRMTETFEELK